MRKSILISTFLNAVNVASGALIARACIQVRLEVITDYWQSILIALIVFFFKKINSMYVVIGGAVLGVAFEYDVNNYTNIT